MSTFQSVVNYSPVAVSECVFVTNLPDSDESPIVKEILIIFI